MATGFASSSTMRSEKGRNSTGTMRCHKEFNSKKKSYAKLIHIIVHITVNK